MAKYTPAYRPILNWLCGSDMSPAELPVLSDLKRSLMHDLLTGRVPIGRERLTELDADRERPLEFGA